ncbi:MAG TPA: ABC transporter permease [Pyrinomonadaceae bacterium]
MMKLWTVVKREYMQRVRAKMFIVSTILLPLVMSLFALVPAIILNIETPPLRVAVVDQTGKMFAQLKQELSSEPDQATTTTGQNDNTSQRRGFGSRGKFVLDEVSANQPTEQIRATLDQRLNAKELDGYIILPPDFLSSGKADFFTRNAGDLVSYGRLSSALNRAVRQQRLIEANVDTKTRQDLFKPAELQAVRIGAGTQERDSGERFALVFGVGLVMYIAILMYGQIILGAVIEEKETRIAEILFSSVKPFTLMMGKLVGVSLVALTQFAIWGLAFSVFVLYGASALAASGVKGNIPSVPISHYIYFGLFFLLGYFIYGTIYALVGSMVTTAQEGGQLAVPIILILVVSFYLFYPVSRSPDSNFSFWVSMIPFTAPVSMLVRIVTQTPPLWQIALSLLIGFGSVLAIMWVTARIYRVGMLMYGKRASVTEALRWARQT